MNADDLLPVGKVVAVQGLKGELRVNPASDSYGGYSDVAALDRRGELDPLLGLG